MNSNHLPYEFAKRQQVLVVDQRLYVGPNVNLSGLLEAQRLAVEFVCLIKLDQNDFNAKLHEHYQSQISTSSQLVSGMQSEMDLLELAAEVNNIQADFLEQQEDALVVRVINSVIAEAIREQASDIHFEPTKKATRIRIRRDGTLNQLIELNAELGPLLVSRIKILGKLNIAERRLPQDGRMTVSLAGRDVDIRISTIPIGGGERVVLRILDRHKQLLSLREIGMGTALLANINKLIQLPHGIVLVTGPTGSGKTTTLYAALQQLDQLERNIMTIEDPIEYDLDSISQTSVNHQTGMTFATGLRSILRQDPDIILIGEIRDAETAKIAVQASLTGHLVFSTLHTNSAVSAITRLMDMGVPPYLLASSIVGILGQRLVRRACPLCTDKTKTRNVEQLCSTCSGTGYSGRVGIFELLEVNDDMRQLIHDQASEKRIVSAANEEYETMGGYGSDMVKAGITSAEEVARVCEVL
jgi:general secretion pathway protein E